MGHPLLITRRVRDNRTAGLIDSRFLNRDLGTRHPSCNWYSSDANLMR